MKIALFGHGNMGTEVERLISQSDGHQIVPPEQADVVIDFTSPEIVLENIKKVASMGKNMVIGTTGWYDNLDKVKKIVNKSGIGLIYGGNFSLGANIFFKIVAYASALFAKFGGYDVYGFEIHHRGKKDSPSGTAKKLSDIIMKNIPSKKILVNSPLQRQIEESELHFASIRGGRNPGRHEIIFDSPADEVRLSHQAHGRGGFALGAIMAAEFIKGKRGLHTFDELFAE